MCKSSLKAKLFIQTLSIEYLKKGEPYAGLISKEHAEEVGAIVLSWSVCRSFLWRLSYILLPRFNVEKSEFENLRFRRRANLIVKTLNDNIDAKNLVEIISETFEIAKTLNDIRNDITHGTFSWGQEFRNGTSIVTMFVDANKRSHEFSLDDLEKIRHEIANTSGRMKEIVAATNPGYKGWLEKHVPSDEISTLQGGA